MPCWLIYPDWSCPLLDCSAPNTYYLSKLNKNIVDWVGLEHATFQEIRQQQFVPYLELFSSNDLYARFSPVLSVFPMNIERKERKGGGGVETIALLRDLSFMASLLLLLIINVAFMLIFSYILIEPRLVDNILIKKKIYSFQCNFISVSEPPLESIL